MNPSDDLVTDLVDAVGERHVLTDPSLTAAYESDWTRRWHGEARCVVRPADTDEVAAVVRACARHGAAVVPQGGNTGLVGGSTPRGGEVVVSLGRLDELGEVDTLAAHVTVGAGVTLAALHEHAAAAGLAYGVNMASRDSATVGGTVATDAGGIRVVRYGTTRAQVVGLEAVLADGSVIRRLDGLVKDTVGYDLGALLIGSEGTLGIVTRVVLRLVPRLEHRVVALLAVDGVPEALQLYRRLRDGVDGIEAIELIHHEGVELVVAHTGASQPFGTPHPSYLLVEVAGRSDPMDGLAAVLGDAPELRDAAVAADGPGRQRLWHLREAHTETISAMDAVPHKFDVSVPLATLPRLTDRLPEVVEAAAPGARLIVFGHLGDGNLHVNVVGPDPDDTAVDDAVLGLVVELGGSISAEHGVGRHKTGYLHLVRSDAEIAAMRALKSALDPDGVLNPGVLLPL